MGDGGLRIRVRIGFLTMKRGVVGAVRIHSMYRLGVRVWRSEMP